MSASKYRREGRRAYCEGDDPQKECPYSQAKMPYPRACWIEGFNEEKQFRDRVRVEDDTILQGQIQED